MADTYQSKYTGAEIDKRLEWAEEISPHIAKQLNTETGIHGVRYWQDKLEYNDGESWVEIETGGGGSFVVKGLYANLAALIAAHPTGEAGDAYAVGTAEDNDVYIWSIVSSDWVNIGPLRGEKGDPGEDGTDGADGRGIVSIIRTSGTGAAGTTDTYTITYSDSTTSTFQVYNGADGEGSGDMLKSIYDPNNKNADAFSMDNMVEGTTNKVFTSTEKTKLAGIAANANNYTHPTTPGNKHIPSGGSNGKILGYDSDGTAKWIDPPAGVEIANNLTTTVAGKALDATQGKALADLISTKQAKTDNTLVTTSKEVVGAINEVFTSASNGKALIAAAITGKNVPTEPTDTYQQMADNIGLLGEYIEEAWFYRDGAENVPFEAMANIEGTSTKQVDHLYSYVAYDSTGTQDAGFTTSVKVDLTDISTLYIDWEATSTAASNAGAQFLVGTDQGSSHIAIVDKTPTPSFGRTIDSLDVSALSGEYYIKTRIYIGTAGNSGKNISSKTYAIRGE